MDLPKFVDNPEFKTIFAEKLARFTALCQEQVAADFPLPTAADPSWHLLSELALTELVIREKINAAAYVQLIKLSNDLEFIFNSRIREGETYEAYRDRMRGRKYEASPAGSVAMYKALTFLYGEVAIGEGSEKRTALVYDCHVQKVESDLLIHILANSEEANLKAALIQALTAAFSQETVKPALDSVVFKAATSVPITISGTIRLLPGYGMDYGKSIADSFREKFKVQQRLGWTPPVSWIIRELHQTGVASVLLRSPSSSIPVQPERYPVISTLDLTLEVSQ